MEERNENFEIEAVNDTEETAVEEQGSGLNTGLAMLIGGAIALGATVAVKKTVKFVKDKRAAKKQAAEAEVVDAEIEEEFDDGQEE